MNTQFLRDSDGNVWRVRAGRACAPQGTFQNWEFFRGVERRSWLERFFERLFS
jgi:hypothetical protein